MNVLVFGAHPDDAELNAGGCGALWAQQGHKVKFVSTTNGDVGHAVKYGRELADIRKNEVEQAAKILGITTEVLDIHDGQLMPTLENRLTFLRLIREWKADIVIGHRPFDYHPDHRNTGILMQDAAFMVTVRNYYPEIPCLEKNPLFLFSYDNFKTPIPFRPDIVVPIDSVIEKKMKALWCLESQIESFFATWNFSEIIPIPTDGSARQKRQESFTEEFKQRWRSIARQYNSTIEKNYGSHIADQCLYAEAFEVCEYGRQPTKKELLKLFPKIS